MNGWWILIQDTKDNRNQKTTTINIVLAIVKLKYKIQEKKDTYPDGREFVGYGIKLDIIVKRTLNDYLTKKDPVMEKAIEHLKQKLK